MAQTLESITLKGFKTIRQLVDFKPGPLTVLVGPNGAGKSNFISFFRLFSWALSGDLQEYVGQQGGASLLLHDGPEVTHEIDGELVIKSDTGDNRYRFRLVLAAEDMLIYADERYRCARSGFSAAMPPPRWIVMEPGGRESRLKDKAEEGEATAKAIWSMLRRIIVHQFHNTSATSRIRQKWDSEDDRWLKEDAANLAPFLRRLRDHEGTSYHRIVETLRLILPFFADFDLEPQYGKLLLSWRERGSDRVFNASQAADGMLRVMALVALLLQPERGLPDVLILDEPELGLHPYAINVVGGLMRSVSQRRQVIVATQSMPLVDCFEPHEIVVVERKNRESVFRRLDEQSLRSWLREYSLSELWEKNVLGGRPG